MLLDSNRRRRFGFVSGASSGRCGHTRAAQRMVHSASPVHRTPLRSSRVTAGFISTPNRLLGPIFGLQRPRSHLRRGLLFISRTTEQDLSITPVFYSTSPLHHLTQLAASFHPSDLLRPFFPLLHSSTCYTGSYIAQRTMLLACVRNAQRTGVPCSRLPVLGTWL
jgi:hypothetical protein